MKRQFDARIKTTLKNGGEKIEEKFERQDKFLVVKLSNQSRCMITLNRLNNFMKICHWDKKINPIIDKSEETLLDYIEIFLSE